MGREFEQGGVEADGLPLALEHRALQVVVQDDPGHVLPGLEGLDVAAQKVLHVCAQEEAQEDASGPGQDHHKGHQGSARLPDLDVAEVAPVALPLLTGQGAQAQVGLCRGAGTVPGDDMAEVVGTSLVATLAGHGVQSAGGEVGELLQGLLNKGQVGGHARGALCGHDGGGAGLGKYAHDGLAVHAKLGRDRAHRPALGVVVAQDLRGEFR